MNGCFHSCDILNQDFTLLILVVFIFTNGWSKLRLYKLRISHRHNGSLSTRADMNCVQEGLIPINIMKKHQKHFMVQIILDLRISNIHICNQNICFKATFILVKASSIYNSRNSTLILNLSLLC